MGTIGALDRSSAPHGLLAAPGDHHRSSSMIYLSKSPPPRLGSHRGGASGGPPETTRTPKTISQNFQIFSRKIAYKHPQRRPPNDDRANAVTKENRRVSRRAMRR